MPESDGKCAKSPFYMTPGGAVTDFWPVFGPIYSQPATGKEGMEISASFSALVSALRLPDRRPGPRIVAPDPRPPRGQGTPVKGRAVKEGRKGPGRSLPVHSHHDSLSWGPRLVAADLCGACPGSTGPFGSGVQCPVDSIPPAPAGLRRWCCATVPSLAGLRRRACAAGAAPLGLRRGRSTRGTLPRPSPVRRRPGPRRRR